MICLIVICLIVLQSLAGCYDMARNELFIQLIYLQFKPLMTMTTNTKTDVLRKYIVINTN